MRAFLWSELDALLRKPPLEFRALHESRVHIFDYRCKSSFFYDTTACDGLRAGAKGGIALM